MINVLLLHGKGGDFLDLGKGGISFKTENHLYRFCDISLGRSSEFSIPDNTHNRNILEIGNDPTMYGDMLRKRFPCRIQHGRGSCYGTIAVTAWMKGEFSCVLYLDDSEIVNKLNDKKLSELPWKVTSNTVWSRAETVYDADDPSVPSLALVKYENGLADMSQWQYLPSIDLEDLLLLLEEAANDMGFPTKLAHPFSVNEYRLVFSTLNATNKYTETFKLLTYNTAALAVGNDMSVVTVTAEWARSLVLGMYLGGGSSTVVGFKPNKNIQVEFSPSTPNNVYLVKMNTRLSQCDVMGGGNDDPLAQRTFQLSKDNIYCFMGKGWLGYDSGGTYWGWKSSDVKTGVDIIASVSADGDMQLGDVWSLANNTPDMTFFELLKSIALATGYDLLVRQNYNEGAGIVETEIFLEDTTPKLLGEVKTIDLKDVISVQEVRRNVEAWGKETGKVTVSFDSEDYVQAPLATDYAIDNEQLTNTDEAKSGFNEGEQDTNGVLIKDVTMEGGTPKLTAKRCTLTRIVQGETYLQRLEAPYMSTYDDIAANSTCVVVKFKAVEADFFELDFLKIYLFRGQMYRWTSADWSAGVMTLTLQRVSEQRSVVGADVNDYVQDGLVLHLDGIEKGDTANAWTSLVGGYKFTATGSPVFNANNVQFDGSSRLGNNSFTAPLANGATIEVVFSNEGTIGVIFSPTAGSKKIAAGLFSTGFIWNIYSNGDRYPVIDQGSISVNYDRCLYNGVAQSSNGNSYFISSAGTVNSIGCRYYSGSYQSYFTGKIYSIRIYNRKLTEAEQLQNRNVDFLRFGI